MHWFKIVLFALCMFAISCAQTTPPAPAPEPVPLPAPSVEPTESPALLSQGVTSEQAEAGRSFLPLSRRFGLSEFVYAGAADNGGVMYRYLLPGETLESWTYLGTLFIFRVGQTGEEAAEGLSNYAEVMQSGVPTLHESENLPGKFGGVAFVHYGTGNGPVSEEGLAALWVVYPGHLANFQVISRSGLYTKRQIDYFKAVAATLARPNEP